MTATAQNMVALEYGNSIRLATAAYLGKVNAGHITLAEALRDCDLPIPLDRLVYAKPRVQRKRLRELCESAGLRQHLSYYRVAGPRVAGCRPLTERERHVLSAVFEEAGL